MVDSMRQRDLGPETQMHSCLYMFPYPQNFVFHKENRNKRPESYMGVSHLFPRPQDFRIALD